MTAHRARGRAAGVGLGALALLAGLLAAPPAQAAETQTVLALGDSITRAATTCGINRDCAEYSWATGSADEVDSIASRLESADPRASVRAVNYAKSGSLINGVESRIGAAVSAGEQPDVVTLLIGGNDLCSLTLAPAEDGYAMTPAAAFADAATRILDSIGDEWPEATVLVGSIPNIEAEWEAVQPTAGAAVWARAGVCRTPRGVDAATGAPLTGAAYGASVAAAVERKADFDEALESACASAANDCVWDRGALSEAPVSLDQLSTDVDWFHPNIAGQAMIADVLWEAWGLGDTAAPAPAPSAPSRDTTAPVVRITAPTSGSTVRGSVTLVASSRDDVGTTRLSFWSGPTRLGEAKRASDGSWRLTVASSAYPSGRYAIIAHAYDAAGNYGRSAAITLSH